MKEVFKQRDSINSTFSNDLSVSLTLEEDSQILNLSMGVPG